jgi:hypothetical protein
MILQEIMSVNIVETIAISMITVIFNKIILMARIVSMVRIIFMAGITIVPITATSSQTIYLFRKTIKTIKEKDFVTTKISSSSKI